LWAKQRKFFLKESQETGSIAKESYTTNCLFWATIIKIHKIQFDLEYGLSGIEDTFF
jgi:hypothetical protein